MNIRINIKKHGAREMANQIVQRTGETVTDAVTAALEMRLFELTREERLARVQRDLQGLR